MSEKKSNQKAEASRPGRQPGQSLFGPIVLIAIGFYFLLGNLGVLPDLNWGAALQLWPLLLIFLGINVIVRQASRPVGTVLSALVAVTTVAVFTFVLLFADSVPLLERWDVDAELKQEQVSYAADGVDRAEIDVDFSSFPAGVSALSDSNNLIEGDVAYRGDLTFATDTSAGEAAVRLDTSFSTGPFFWINPANWSDGDGEDASWRIGLNPGVPLDLRLDLASGMTVLDLAQLTLTALAIDGGSGETTLALPAGAYDVHYDMSSGDVEMTLPDSGTFTYEIEGSSGDLLILLPASLEARIIVEDGGSGRFSPGDRFTQTEERDDDEGTWETAGYEDATDRVTMILDRSSGDVTVE